MKFLGWLFDATTRHYREASLYEKGGVMARLGFIAFLAVMTGLTVGCEFWMFTAFSTSLPYGLAIMCVYFVMISVTCEYSAVFSIFGFVSAITGSLDTYMEKRKKRKRKGKDVETSPITDNNPIEYDKTSNGTQKEEVVKTNKPHKFLDVIVGISGVLFALGNIILTILLFFVKVSL